MEILEVGDPKFSVWKRPGLQEFCDFANNNFEIFIFTSSERNYADPIIDAIFPSVDRKHRMYKDSCELKKGQIYKDIQMFERDPKRLIFVDDSRSCQTFFPKNSLRIMRWEGSPFDKQLTKWLIPILQRCANASDVRDVISSVSRKNIFSILLK
jgi:TFIIF-interacting CTD phosphatase-like protein